MSTSVTNLNTLVQVQLITPRAIAILAQKDRVERNLQDVTLEQIAACQLIEGQWNVLSASTSGTVYHPTWTPEFGYQCDCMSGKNGFATCRNPSGVCWHVRVMAVKSLKGVGL